MAPRSGIVLYPNEAVLPGRTDCPELSQAETLTFIMGT